MSKSVETGQYQHHLSPLSRAFVRGIGRAATFALAAASVLILVLHVTFIEVLPSTRLAPLLVVLTLLHLARYPKIVLCPELLIYTLFFVYLLVQLSWTGDLALAMNTIVPALNFVLTLILFCAVARYHDLHTAAAGWFFGFIAGAVIYASSTGFPFAYPTDFSYNAVAVAYLFGLFLTLLIACLSKLRTPLIGVALIAWAHVVATGSIKTNLGIFAGGLTGAIVYLRQFAWFMKRNFVLFVVIAGALGSYVASNDSLRTRIDSGVDRVMLGIELLRVRESLPGYSAFESRTVWMVDGLHGWTQNPVFGHGVEAFRSHYGITSHSTPVDLLYNSGIIGTLLFYSVFAALAWRLVATAAPETASIRFLVSSALVCFTFISLTGTMHYNALMAAFIAISAAILRRDESVSSAVNAHT